MRGAFESWCAVHGRGEAAPEAQPRAALRVHDIIVRGNVGQARRRRGAPLSTHLPRAPQTGHIASCARDMFEETEGCLGASRPGMGYLMAAEGWEALGFGA